MSRSWKELPSGFEYPRKPRSMDAQCFYPGDIVESRRCDDTIIMHDRVSGWHWDLEYTYNPAISHRERVWDNWGYWRTATNRYTFYMDPREVTLVHRPWYNHIRAFIDKP